ncbi:MAG: response regulator [Planctomycetes bacterium]|nr:response regulator [Planctomycetota bacterium]
MKTLHILVIEDHPLNLELVTDLLQAAGYSVLQAKTAEDGIRLAQDSFPDLILMDIGLPGIDGIDAARQLKGDDRTRAIPILALTAYAMPEDERNAREAGCAGFIPKPIQPRKFLERIGQCFPGPEGPASQGIS